MILKAYSVVLKGYETSYKFQSNKKTGQNDIFDVQRGATTISQGQQ